MFFSSFDTSSSLQLKKTPLNKVHRNFGAKMIDFGGWEMPVQYTSIIEEHMAVRLRAGLFDVSHMGECEITGPDALDAMQWLMANDMDIDCNCSRYTTMCNNNGGIVDDLIVYRKSEDTFFVVLNASNTEKDIDWIKRFTTKFDVNINDLSNLTAQIALQGPLAEKILQKLTKTNLKEIKKYCFSNGLVDNIPCMIARTGYTGEDGFEIYFLSDYAEKLWYVIFNEGKEYGILPCGLGARDSLRLEAGMMLYGNDLDDFTSPLETTISYTVDLSKEFLGKKQIVANNNRKMIGFIVDGKGIARHGDIVIDNKTGKEVGKVTSGLYSPCLKKAIGLAMIYKYAAKPSLLEYDLSVSIRGSLVKIQACSHRFYKEYKKHIS